jgi:hypothetical protein
MTRHASDTQPGALLRPFLALGIIAILGPAHARSQAQLNTAVDMRATQSGRLLDANPSVLGGRYNAARPSSPLLGGNYYAAGLARRGASLRIADPIPASTAFRGTLGSSSLSAFRRDSVSISDPSYDSGLYIQPYYDPASTVGSVGFLRGFAPYASTGVTPGRIDTRIIPQTSLTAQIVGLQTTPQRDPGTDSGIFGLQVPSRTAYKIEQPRFPWDQPINADLPQTQSERQQMLEDMRPMNQDGTGELWPLSTPLDIILDAERRARTGLTTGSMLPSDALVGFPREDARPGLILPPRGEREPTPSAATSIPPISDPSLLPGFDMFNTLQMAVSLSANGDAAWLDDLTAAMQQKPELSEQIPEEALSDAEQFIKRLLDEPLRTFIGGGPSGVNNELLKAEGLMELGRYQEAADHYQMASIIDPQNPLPYMGRGHALLAQGEYRSAAFEILRGLQRYPEITRFSLDLTSLMGGAEVIDIRRADIMKRLAQRESPELRFLLGYLEYHSGDRERGLANLDRAAKNPRAGSFVARYPDLLRGTEPPPPPKIPLPGERPEPEIELPIPQP